MEYIFEWRRQFGRVRITASMRRKNQLWGRFGGGWQWKLGVQVSNWRCILISLLVMEIMIYIAKKEDE